MKASSIVMGLSGVFVTADGAGAWLNRGLSDIRRTESPGKTWGRVLMTAHESMLFCDRSTVARLRENISLEPASPSTFESGVEYTRLILFPRRDNRLRVGKDVKARKESRHSNSLKPSVSSLMVCVMGMGISDNWFESKDIEVRDGKRFEIPTLFSEVSTPCIRCELGERDVPLPKLATSRLKIIQRFRSRVAILQRF